MISYRYDMNTVSHKKIMVFGLSGVFIFTFVSILYYIVLNVYAAAPSSGKISSKELQRIQAESVATQQQITHKTSEVAANETKAPPVQDAPAVSGEGVIDDEPESKNIFARAADTIVSKVQTLTGKISTSASTSSSAIGESTHPWHKDISTTVFWVGEEAGKDNKNISNLPSAWDEQWAKHYGGVDSPKKRTGYNPSQFEPKENPFYFALPYNDFDEKGKRKAEAEKIIPWAKVKEWGKEESMLKNQWIKLDKNGKIAYAQWQDVGPFKEDDGDYVFGTSLPKSKTNKHAGLDVSPAVHDFLNLSDIDTVSWQFANPDQVPDGPWKEVVTTSQIYWK